MTAELKPYPDYKASGMEWLGAVPAHWEVRHLGRVGRLFKGGGGTKEDERESGVPCVRYGDLYTQHRFFITASRACVAPELAATAYTPLRYGDVLFAGSGETIDEIGKSAVNLIRGSACCGGDVIIFRPSICADPRFLGYVSDCPSSARQKACMGRGFTVMHIYSSDLKYMAIPLPPGPEQAAIVRFLDRADRRVRRYIRARERLIALLEEQKQALIHEAVTGRIDVRTGRPYPAYKDSGVEWLGAVPAHWGVRRLRTSIRGCINGIWGDDPTGHNDLACVRVANFERKSWCVDSSGQTLRSISPNDRAKRLLGKGDLLLEKSGGGDLQPVGIVVIYEHDVPAVCSNFIARMPVRSGYSAKYLTYLHACLYTKRVNIRSIKQTTGIQNLDTYSYLNERVGFPPLPEQARIVRFLDRATDNMRAAVTSSRRQIERVREYRACLIADVVTGKLDVREAAARLPEIDPLVGDDEPNGDDQAADVLRVEAAVVGTRAEGGSLVRDDGGGAVGREAQA